MRVIKPQQIVVHSGSCITAEIDGKLRAMILAEDAVVELPLLKDVAVMRVEYDPRYGDHKLCKCGHNYGSHFDMFSKLPSGCLSRNCVCDDFEYDAKATSKAIKKSKKMLEEQVPEESLRQKLIRAALERKKKNRNG